MNHPQQNKSDAWQQGVLENNPALVQLLGLCPLLAVSNTLVNAIGLGLATLLTVTLTNTLVSALRPVLRQEVRIAMFVIIIAGTVTVIERLMEAWLFDLHGVLGIFIPLIVTNCLILARAEAYASRHNVAAAALDGLAMGSGFMLALLLMGAIREIIGYSTLLRDAGLLFGGWLGDDAQALTLYLAGDEYHFLLFSLPPGAFLILGLLVAAHRQLLQRRQQDSHRSVQTAQSLSQQVSASRQQT
ncbi:MAG: electron transport complex subunit E [Wenzhouxiangellaceae bacterium]